MVIRQRWEVVSIVNDILIAIWFIAGSVLFFGESTTTAGTWLFLVGSIELLIRPLIRLARRVHLQRLHPNSSPSESDEF
ncbi:MAG: YrhK family protein [Williamsia sp.]|nr:YrhK family protein [Williamsia sp.]